MKLKDWLKCNKLFWNYEKTKYVIFHAKKKKVQNFTDPGRVTNGTIERELSVIFVGTNIEENLDWKCHINYVCSEISRSIGILSSLNNFI